MSPRGLAVLLGASATRPRLRRDNGEDMSLTDARNQLGHKKASVSGSVSDLNGDPAVAEPVTPVLAFAPLHKRALGIATGTATGLLVFLATAVYLLRPAEQAFKLGLLGQYFFGYTVSWQGALIGLGWGFFTGFVVGWFVAFCRNLVVAISLFLSYTRAELAETRDFLDHI